MRAKQILIGFIISILFILMADFNNRMNEWYRLTGQQDQIAAQTTNLVQTQSSLQTQIADATSVAAVEEWAYSEGRFVRSGDQPVVPVPVNNLEVTPVSTVIPQNTQEVVQNWEVWFALFFDLE